MDFIASQIAGLLEGTVVGNENISVNNLSKIEEGQPNTLSFLSNLKYEEYLYTTGASIVIVDKSFEPSKSIPNTCTLIKVESAQAAFAKLLEIYNQVKRKKSGIHPSSYISDSATIGEEVYIGANCSIGDNVTIGNNVHVYPNSYIGDNVKIGDDCMFFAGVRVYSDCLIGKSCTLHSGVIIGGDGFGFVPNRNGNYSKVPQIGNAILEDHVEIGSNTTIDRATLGSTIIRKGVKLDNLIQVAHNVEIGENTVIAAQTGIAGSTKIGKNCMIGGQVGIVGHITIADEVKIAAQSGVGHAITEKGQILQGSPAFPIGDYKRSYVVYRGLPDLKRKVDELEKKLSN
ncbi:UDP-3-O-(3-hydroxymyristoyl)glucosamine N-acyltransferase [Flavobacteriales bacterium]|jgi:UDP-3-O-[3-hydroxymyristoyl] glucosamine N-acyltransferase|nr:UDP-3-O-(3-hydroxymyristoyl)glucosamine N-acyltransferase [Flavobacteriales bacterium]MDC1370922.1 UDP-3-O-(3-hydroxymyristoyl)glucosamine N-acyltransferase [Flavobacteriales bacterium]|tara:strand:- start:784 stop:1815 length:1032 start_codon:yes stop_codon:yes gene_type:complete